MIEFNRLLDQIGDGVPDAEQYRRMSAMILEFPEAQELTRMDPFEPGYKAAAMDLYLFLRGRAEQGYRAERDEKSATELPENAWAGIVPWSFGEATTAAEHVLAWGHILAHANLPRGGALLEYGPGSGQVLLMLARMGYRACGVDIDPLALDIIQFQARQLNIAVETEHAAFGQGFTGQTFDTVLFYESFHHAFEFEDLLAGLHRRLNPGGRVLLCGEPVVHGVGGGIPYPWGPRLNALSVFCMRRFGWMELGFTHDYFMRVAQRHGWAPSFHPFPNCGRAAVYVLQSPGEEPPVAFFPPPDDRPLREIQRLEAALAAAQAELAAARAAAAALRASTSWRVTAPLRAAKDLLDRLR